MLNKRQLAKMDDWMRNHARPLEIAKWDYLFGGGGKEAIGAEILKYQNLDGGLGHGFDPDLLLPSSANVPSAEALFQVYDYGLDPAAWWFVRLLSYFERAAGDGPGLWEPVPRAAADYPHAPWRGYRESPAFSPDPCALVASALTAFGSKSQKRLGERAALTCLNALAEDLPLDGQECRCLAALVEKLLALKSPLLDGWHVLRLKRRMAAAVCLDMGRWHEYYPQPLDFADSPISLWYDAVASGIPANFRFWLDTLNAEGVWEPNFSWGSDSVFARQAAESWKGIVTAARARVLMRYGMIEGLTARGPSIFDRAVFFCRQAPS